MLSDSDVHSCRCRSRTSSSSLFGINNRSSYGGRMAELRSSGSSQFKRTENPMAQGSPPASVKTLIQSGSSNLKKMTAPINPQDIYFVLVRPVYLGNIGAFARLLKNFGFRHLRFVDAPKNYKDAEARKMAVGAFDLLKSSETFTTLKEAVADVSFVVGTTAGQQRSQSLMPLTQALEKVRASSGNKIAIVFGDERNGLSNEEIALCHILTRIETDKQFPSLNVAQAACVMAYELSRVCGLPLENGQNAPEVTLPTGKSDHELFEQVEILLDRIEFSRKFNKDVVTKELRRFYYKAAPTKRESDLLRGVLHKLNQALACPSAKHEAPDE